MCNGLTPGVTVENVVTLPPIQEFDNTLFPNVSGLRVGLALQQDEQAVLKISAVRSALEQPKKPPVTPVQSVLSMTRFPSMNSFDSLVYLFSDGDVPESLIGKPYSYIASGTVTPQVLTCRP
jgi:hypothetical protein